MNVWRTAQARTDAAPSLLRGFRFVTLFEARDGTEHFVLYACWNIKEGGDNSM